MSACDRSNLFIAESLFAESCLRFASLLAAIDEIYVIETRLVSKNRILINGTTIQNRFILFNHFFNDIDISLVRIDSLSKEMKSLHASRFVVHYWTICNISSKYSPITRQRVSKMHTFKIHLTLCNRSVN